MREKTKPHVRIDRREFIRRGTFGAGALVGGSLLGSNAARGQIAPRRALAIHRPRSPVAVRRCKRYDRDLVHDRLGLMFADLGGLSALVAGKSVAIKINGTGTGKWFHSVHSKMAHATHPELVYATCRHLLDAGATKIRIMESWQSPDDVATLATLMDFDVAEFEALGSGDQVRFFHTRNKDTEAPNPDVGYPAYARIDVDDGVGGGDPYLFDYFYVNRMWAEADVIVSMAKLKGHELAGVTLSMKNLFGCLPNSIYGNDAEAPRPNEDAASARISSCHNGAWNEGGKTPLLGEITGANVVPFGPHRMPSLVADLVRALPIDLAIIDGITGTQSAWGPVPGTSITTPGVLVVGRNSVCTDAACVGIMGHDPRAPTETGMFLSGLNHLELAAARGVGSNNLSRIPIIGDSIESVRYDYYPPVNIADERPS